MHFSDAPGVTRTPRPPDKRSPSAPRWLRRAAVLMSATFLWTTLLATPSQVLAQAPQKPVFGPPKPIPAPVVHDDPAWHTIDYHAQEHAPARPVPGQPVAAPLTLLDEVGRLTHPVDAAQVAEWKRLLHRPRLLPLAQAARLHLWLGEYALSHDEQPETAQWHFAQAQKASKHNEAVYGVAAYDKAIAAFYEGAYNQAQAAFQQVLAARPALHGFDRRTATLFLRHAGACAGYHAERAAVGIPEPPKLDPLCGAAAIAIALKTAGKPYDRKTVLTNVHVTGRGSSLQDVVNGARKLGLAAHVVTADDKTLIALPKPLVAYVEHDHFISVLGADKQGVSYMCSDCGAWPGGRVSLTWAQWHKLEATHYAVLTTPNSDTDEALSLLKRTREQKTQGVQLASLSRSLNGDVVKQTRLLKRLQSIGFPWPIGGLTIICGFGPASQHCPDPVNCPTDGGPPCDDGPSTGDPVNLATGEEEYTPGADLKVYNPVGPSVSWSRLYNSLRGTQQGYQSNDLGQSWSHAYNLGVVATITQQGASKTATCALIEPNGVQVTLTTTQVPSAATPRVTCGVPAGYPMLAEWDYDSATGGTYFVFTHPDRSKWITLDGNASPFSQSGGGGGAGAVRGGTPLIGNSGPVVQWFALGQIADRNANVITFRYTSPTSGFPLLTSIVDKNNAALLTVTRDANNALAHIDDRYGRSVYYHIGTYTTANVPQGHPQSLPELDHVSQVVLTGTASPPDRYVYGYQNVTNGELYNGQPETIPMLHTLTVPSPTGTGTATATINYSANATIASLVDANGNSRSYTQPDANHTQVIVKDPQGNIVYRYTAGYDMNMSLTSLTNGLVDANGKNTQIIKANTYADPNDPYRSSQVQDGNGYAAGGANGKGTWTYTWDQYGNCLTVITPRQTQTTNTFVYTNFALGELTKTQTAGQQATTYAYFEPSGNVKSVTSPLPGTVNGTQTVTTSYTYSALGNLLTKTTPGNGTVASMTTTYGYTADGTYSQNEALGQPLTVSDNLGKTTHMRYDVQGHPTGIADPLGNTSNRTYNLTEQLYQILMPATGQTGTGRSAIQYTYLYPGGPPSQAVLYDESGTQVRQITPVYGREGEHLGATGDLPPVTIAYDALYRTKTLTDGNNHVNPYLYAPAGYPQQATFANGDIYQATAWDANGNMLTIVDGRGTTANYVYNDPESKLTDVQYPGTPTLNVHMDYDAYGRATYQTENVGSRTAGYDDLDQPLSEAVTYFNAARTATLPTLTLTYGYNPDGSRSSLSTPAGSFTYIYDGRGLPASVTNPYGETFGWTYLDNGWLWTQSTGNLFKSIYTYNALGQATDLAHRQQNMAQTLLADFGSMSQDAAGNRLSMTASLPAAPASYSGMTTYAHDNRNQLKQETSGRAGGYNNGYGYDQVGNPTTWKGNTQTFNAANQNTQGGTLTFDGNGNPAGWQGTPLTWDANNNLTSVGTVLTAGYLANGLRAWKQSASSRIYFLYDGLTPVCETDANGSVTAVNTWGANGLLARRTGGSSVFYAFDPQGNVSLRLNSAGNILSSHCNDAWGTQVSTVASNDPYAGYGGQWGYYRDGETGLHLLGHRYYDTSTGRFLNRDPIGYGGGVNMYAYCQNMPLTWEDSDGLQAKGGLRKGEEMTHSSQKIVRKSCVNLPQRRGRERMQSKR